MSWDQLLGIISEAHDIDEKEQQGPPTSCAVDYTPLKGAEEGKLYCPWCGLVWPDDASAWGRFPGSY